MNSIETRVVAFTLCLAALNASPSDAEVPYQWIAKQYTEVLGRVPDASGWKGAVDWFTANTCTKANLKTYGRGFMLSDEFNGLGYLSGISPANHKILLFVAYRAILSREPDQSGFDAYLACLNSGACTWSSLVDALYDSVEFDGFVPAICDGENYQDSLGGLRPIPIGGSRTQDQLEADLAAFDTVSLQPQEVVYLTRTLNIPANKTLTTSNVANKFQTAKMARLVRDDPFNDSLVISQGTISRVWIDGQGGRPGFAHGDDATSLTIARGTVTESRISEPLGFSSVHAFEPCAAPPTITNNLVTSYTSDHPFYLHRFVDGLSISCSGSYVAGNGIIDATDVGIVLFSRSIFGGSSGQNITIENNTVIAAGRSAYGGLVVCDALGIGGVDARPALCNGSSMRNNSLWTSGLQHFDIGLSVGTYPWTVAGQPSDAWNGSATNNFTPTGVSVRVKNAIVVDGVTNVTVQGNTFSAVAVETENGCQPMDAGVSADASGGHASGSIQTTPTYANRAVHSCVGHN